MVNSRTAVILSTFFSCYKLNTFKGGVLRRLNSFDHAFGTYHQFNLFFLLSLFQEATICGFLILSCFVLELPLDEKTHMEKMTLEHMRKYPPNFK